MKKGRKPKTSFSRGNVPLPVHPPEAIPPSKTLKQEPANLKPYLKKMDKAKGSLERYHTDKDKCGQSSSSSKVKVKEQPEEKQKKGSVAVEMDLYSSLGERHPSPPPPLRRISGDRNWRQKFSFLLNFDADSAAASGPQHQLLTSDNLNLYPTNSDFCEEEDVQDFPKCQTKHERLKANIMMEIEKLGFGNGFQIPFINDELIALQGKLEKQLEHNLNLKIAIQNSKIHNEVLEEEILDLGYELDCCTNIKEATQRDYKTTDLLSSLEERVNSFMTQDIARKKEILMEYCERNCRGEEILVESRSRVDTLALNHQINQDVMESFKQQAMEVEDLDGKIDYFKRLDKHVVLDFEERYREAVTTNRALRLELDFQAKNTNKCHEMYNRMTIDFRKSYRQRRDLISWWIRSAQQMKIRDEEIREITEEFFEERERCLQLRTKIYEIQDKLEEKIEENAAIKKKLSHVDIYTGNIQGKIYNSRSVEHMLQKEVLNQEIEIAQLRAVTKEAKNKIKNLPDKNEWVLETWQDAEAAWYKVCEEFYIEQTETEDHFSTIRRMERMLMSEFIKQTQLERHLYKLRKFLWERCLDKERIHVAEQRMEDRSQRLGIQLGILQSKSLALTDKISARQGKVYRLELDLSTMEVNVIALTNATLDPQIAELIEHRNQRQEVYNHQATRVEFLANEVGRTKEGIDNVRLEIKQAKHRRFQLKAQVYSNKREERRLEKICRATEKNHRDTSSLHNVLNLILTKSKEHIVSGSGKKMRKSLELMAVKAAAKEHAKQVAAKQELLEKEIMEREKNLQKSKVNLNQVQSTVAKLKSRFEVSLEVKQTSEEKKKELISIYINHIRGMAREKEHLAIEWRNWNDKLNETEKENLGFTNSILVMDVQNENLRKSLAKAAPGSCQTEAYDGAILNEQKVIVMKRRAAKANAHIQTELTLTKKAVLRSQRIVESQQARHEAEQRGVSAMQIRAAQEQDKLRRWDAQIASMLKRVNHKMTDKLRKEVEIQVVASIWPVWYNVCTMGLNKIMNENPSARRFIKEYFEKSRREMLESVPPSAASASASGVPSGLDSGPPSTATTYYPAPSSPEKSRPPSNYSTVTDYLADDSDMYSNYSN